MLQILQQFGVCMRINANATRLIAIFSFLFLVHSASAQTGKALSFDGTNDYVSLPIGLNGSYTKEAWINAASFTGIPNILSGNGTALYLNAGRLAAGHATGSFSQLLDPVTLLAGTWYHVAVTYDAGTGNMLLYKNGIVVNSATAVPGYTEPFLEIGRYSGSNNFNGTVDEVRLWNTVRTGAEISGSMNCELTGDEPGLLACYNFNQGTAGGTNTGITTLNDSKDACIASNGTLNNFALAGAGSNWVAPGPVLSGTCANSFANITVTGNSNCISDGDITPSATDFTYFGDFGSLPITRNFIIQNTGNAVLNVGSVTITGINAADFTISTSPASSLAASATSTLGVTFNPGGANGIKNATITINNSDADEAVFTFDIAGNRAGGAQALAFDGVNDRVDLPVAFSGSYTKEAWINTNVLTGFPNILTGNASTGTGLYLNTGRLAAGHAPAFTQITDPTPLIAGTWYHAAVTYNAGTGIMNLYKNGVLVGTAAVPAYTETNQQIGSFNGGNFFNGYIDDVRIWSVVRSGAEITANMNCELIGIEPGLIAYYNFNQGAAGGDNTGLTLLNDLAGNCPQNGTLFNFALNGNISNWVNPGGTPVACTTQIPNISVAGNNICIVAGDLTPSIPDNTNFGPVNISTTLDHNFVITNNGAAPLTISSILVSGTDAAMFTIVSAPASSVLPGASTTFTIRFAPTAPNGIKNATVTINNNDFNEAAYIFAVRGESFGSTVPVTMLYFRANDAGRYSRLIWETTLENNNKGFAIERSVNGSNNWETIGFVEGTNAANGSRYQFNDLAPFKGANTYRLRQINTDNSFKWSDVEIVNFDYDAALVSVYPNPVKETLNIVFNDPSLLNTNATITTASGAVIAAIKLNSYRQPVDMSAYAKGMYFISLQNGTVLKLVKE